jgi:hypothetical protein
MWQALEQMDASGQTFGSLPLVMGATLAIVCLVLLVAFRSLLVPIRAARRGVEPSRRVVPCACIAGCNI